MTTKKDDDLYWNDNISPTYNNLMKINESKKPHKTQKQKEQEYNDQKNLILQHFHRICGYDYLVIDIHKIINKFVGINFEWKWSINYISNDLALYNGFRTVTCCATKRYDGSIIHAKDKIFDGDSTSIDEYIKFKINCCTFKMQLGIISIITNKYIWFEGKQLSTKIETGAMSTMKKQMFGAVFGHLPSQTKGMTIKTKLRAGDIIEIRLIRKDRSSKYCSMEVRYIDGNWQMIQKRIAVPVYVAANLWSIQDSVSFVV
eukprot:116357_1